VRIEYIDPTDIDKMPSIAVTIQNIYGNSAICVQVGKGDFVVMPPSVARTVAAALVALANDIDAAR